MLYPRCRTKKCDSHQTKDIIFSVSQSVEVDGVSVNVIRKQLSRNICKIYLTFDCPEEVILIDNNGRTVQLLQEPDWFQGDEDPDPGAGRSRQDDHPLQAAGRRGGHHHPYHRIQRGDRGLQEFEVPSVGSRRPDEHPAVLAVLLHQHGRHHLRGGQRGPGQGGDQQAGARLHVGGGRVEGCSVGGAG